MKPITNLLLVVAIACYSLLTFYVVQMHGSISGLGFTTGAFSKGFSSALFALLPFIACFGAIAVNSLKSRYWGLLVVAFIGLGIYFFASSGNYHTVEVVINPGLSPSDSVGEAGLRVEELGLGHRIPHILLWIALVSAVISILPFKFNKKLEQTIDHQLHNAREHVSKLGHEHKESKVVENKANEEPEVVEPVEEKQPAELSDEERYASYMPPQDDEQPPVKE